MTITPLRSHKFSMSESWGNGVAKVLMKIPEWNFKGVYHHTDDTDKQISEVEKVRHKLDNTVTKGDKKATKVKIWEKG